MFPMTGKAEQKAVQPRKNGHKTRKISITGEANDFPSGSISEENRQKTAQTDDGSEYSQKVRDHSVLCLSYCDAAYRAASNAHNTSRGRENPG